MMETRENLNVKVENWVKELKEHLKECEREGHKDVMWFGYNASSHSSYRDQVLGMCRYCLSFIERPLNEEEARRITSFYDSLNIPFRR